MRSLYGNDTFLALFYNNFFLPVEHITLDCFLIRIDLHTTMSTAFQVMRWRRILDISGADWSALSILAVSLLILDIFSICVSQNADLRPNATFCILKFVTFGRISLFLLHTINSWLVSTDINYVNMWQNYIGSIRLIHTVDGFWSYDTLYHQLVLSSTRLNCFNYGLKCESYHNFVMQSREWSKYMLDHLKNI